MKRPGTTRLVSAAFACGAAAALTMAASAQVTVSGQGYTESEALRGQQAYADNCASCHGTTLAGAEFGPPLKGREFAAHWQGRDDKALLAYVQTQMPPGKAGALAPAVYRDIVAFMIKANAADAGGSASGSDRPAAKRDAIETAVLAARKAKLDALSPVTDSMLANPSDNDWLTWRRTYDQNSFSNLKQINKSNVGRLSSAWSWQMPASGNQITPLVHDGVMFVQSGDVVQALDATNGEVLWQYVRTLPPALERGRNAKIKSIAIYKDKLLVPTADRRLVALNIHTGALLWDVNVADGPNDLFLSSAPIVVRGKVILGTSIGLVAPGGCFILALDVETGKEVWRFNTIARPGQPGGDSWNGAPVEERYGAGVWTAGSYDPKRNLLYFGVGQTYTAGTLLLPQPRKGESNDALYTDATVALDPDTGKLVWHFQHLHRDVWDLDWVFERTLATMMVDGKPRDVVATAGKLGMFDVLDRGTGQYLFSRDVGIQNLITAIDPKTGRKTTNPALEPESGVVKLVCPSYMGARNWPTTAYNPNTRVVYVPLLETCSNYMWTARSAAETAKGGSDMTLHFGPMPQSDGKFGRMDAINLETGKVLWSVRQRATVIGSTLATAGGVVFSPLLDRRLRAYDDLTGKILWEGRLNAPARSSPITYSVAGEQYVAVVTGGPAILNGTLAPEIINPVGDVTVVVFKLPRVAK